MAPSSRASERRQGDRRRRPTRFWDGLRGPRRRHGGRRHRENERLYVDRYRRRDVALVLATFVLNILDALFTLWILQRGGSEQNPFMQRLLEAGHASFLIEKCLVVGFWLVLLAVHRNFRLAYYGLWMLFGVYAALFVWHLWLHALATAA